MRREGSNRWPTWSWGVAALIVAVYLVLGGLFPDADPTHWLPAGLESRVDEFLVEGPAKAHEARNWALFGEFHRNPADNYQFWRAQSPVWVYPLALSFRVFGTNYVTLRLFGLLIGTGGLLGIFLLLRRTVPAWAGLGAAALYATNVFSTFFARSGLIEIWLNTASVWMVACLLAARRHPAWLVAAQLIFTLGFFGKQGMIYLFPLLVGVNLLLFARWWRSGEFGRARWLPVLSAVVLAVVAVVIILQPDYIRAITWNSNHILLGREGDNPSGSAWFLRFDGLRLWRTYALLTPVIGALVVPGAIWMAWTYLQERRLPWREGVLLAWAASAWLAALGPHDFTLRQASIVMIPNVIVAALVASRLQSLSRRTLLPWLGAVGLFALALHSSYQVRRYEEMRWHRQKAVREIIAELGDGPAVVVGRHAMPMLLATPYDVYYVKIEFNTSKEALHALAPTHLLLSKRDYTGKHLSNAEPHIRLGAMLVRAKVTDHSMKLIPITWPTTPPPQPIGPL